MSLRARHIPNMLTGLRIALALPLGWLIVSGRYDWALLLFLVAGATDAIDGFLAKRFGWVSWIGAVLDPIADKTLNVVCLVSLGLNGVLAIWLVVLVIIRDLVIVSGAASYYLLVENFEPEPTLVSKLNTLLLLMLILAALVDRGLVTLPSPVLPAMSYLAATTTIISGAGYVWNWSTRARRHGPERRRP
jgi:cardiolipin synthase